MALIRLPTENDYNGGMLSAELRQDERSSSSRRRRKQFSLRALLSVVSGVSTLFSAMNWLPGLGGLLLLMFGWIWPAAAFLGVLILLQWPMMIVAVRLSHAHRDRLREERRAFILSNQRR